ncbi:hypothetical protein KKG46_00005, partial [Patescibacteria group bacterium]|nr:hypothetical protein [Patescibacteria group bacterium]
MKRIQHFLLATGIGVLVFASELGCVFDNEPFKLAEAAQNAEDFQDSKLNNKPELNFDDFVLEENDSETVDAKIPVEDHQKNNPTDPNSIILETCEPDPDEVAVPLNVEEDKECHKVHAQGIFADSNGVSKVAVKYTWSVTDNSVVSIVGYPATKHNSSIVLEAKYDIFSEPNLTQEPSVTVTVCVEPESGWQSATVNSLCRSLPVHVVANMQGSWCFEGDQFTPDHDATCHSLYIQQDGRFLTIGADDHGTIYEKQLDFYYDNLEYRTVESSSYEISGIVLAGEDVEGSFSAFRLPL